MKTASAGTQRGFTLLELSIVLALIAVITSGGLAMMTASVQSAAFNNTVTRMDALEKALLDYAVANGRIPCPSDLTITPGSANYGVEAANKGTCWGGTPAATFKAASNTVEGGVPTRALQLPDAYMYDGWNRRFRYAVDPAYTAASSLPVAAVCSPPTPDATAITVNDSTGAARSTAAIYVLISSGANGHGAYTSNGAVRNAGSTSTDEQTNCHCNASAVATTYAPTYVQKTPAYDAGHSGSALYYYDDLVTFKDAWQMQAPNFPLTAGPSCGAQYLALVSQGASSCPHIFYLNNGTFTNLPDPPTCAGYWEWSGAGADFTPDNKTLAWGYSLFNSNNSYTNTGILYNVVSTGFTYSSNNITSIDDIGALEISPDGNYMATAGCTLNGATTACTSYYLRLYSKASTFSTIVGTASPVPTFQYYSLAWSPDGNTLYASDYGNSPNGVEVYTHSGNSLTWSKTLSAGDVCWPSAAVHPSGNYLAMSGGCNTRPYVINNPLGAVSEISAGASGLVDVAGGQNSLWVAWSPDGKYFGVANTDATVLIYGFNSAGPGGVYFTQETISGYVCKASGGAGQYVAFSKDSQYAAFTSSANDGSGQLCVYKRNAGGTVWTNVYTGPSFAGDALLPVWSK